MQSFITAKQNEIADLCRTHHVRRFSVFGSAVRDDFDPVTSDIDVRVEFHPDALDNYARNLDDLHDRLTKLFGRKVDLLSAQEIRNPRLRKIIEEAQVTLYAA
jgi:uncharacterized protein